MRALLLIGMLCVCLTSEAQLTGSTVIKDNGDTTYVVAEFICSSPDFTYFKLNDTVYKLETRYFMNPTVFRQIPVTSYEQDMYNSFRALRNAYYFAAAASATSLLTFGLYSAEEPQKGLYTAGFIVSCGFAITSSICHMNFINRGIRANQKALAVHYKL